jgi:Ca-activated chloride channel family protein
MMKLFFVSVFTLVLIIDPTKISKINTAKSEAKNAYLSGDYKTAIKKYKFLTDSLDVKEDEVMFNLGNAYFLEKDSANAMSTFQSLTNSAKREISSKAHQQLGVMANQKGKFEQALNDFKQAIKADPTNESARYDYEMLKKKLEEKKKQDQKNQDKKDPQDKKEQQDQDKQNKDQKDQKDQKDKKDQQDQKDKQDQKDQKDQKNKDDQKDKKDQQNKDQQKKDGKDEEQKKEEQEKQQSEQQDKDKKDQSKKDLNFNSEKLPQISQQKAEMILEAMKNQEKQYLQQQKRKGTKAKDRNKPDW